MKVLYFVLLILGFVTVNAMAADYVIDKKGMHASIQFKVSHLGYSWLWGRFNDFEGNFSYDKKNLKMDVTINTSSVDSNHAERDKHLRSPDFLDVVKFPQSKFVSTSYKGNKDGTGILKGDFTLHGVTKPIAIKVKYINEGKDPWDGYRIGFEGKSKITLADYGILKNLGPASKDVELFFVIEGIRQGKK